MGQANILHSDDGFTRAAGDENIFLSRTALTCVGLGHLMLILPGMAAFQDATLFEAYYLNPSILTLWVVGLGLDLTVVVSLFEGRLENRKWLTITAASLVVLALLPWLEVYLGSLFDYGPIRGTMPLPWATTHLGPVGSTCAGIGAALAVRALRTTDDAPPGVLLSVGAIVLAVQAALFALSAGTLY